MKDSDRIDQLEIEVRDLRLLVAALQRTIAGLQYLAVPTARVIGSGSLCPTGLPAGEPLLPRAPKYYPPMM